MDKMVDVDEKADHDLSQSREGYADACGDRRACSGKLLFSVRFQSAAEIAERDRKIKELAPKIRAAAEAKAAKEAKEAAELAEKNKVPKVAVTLPADAKDVKQTNDSIKFTVGKGKAKAAVESLRKQFRDAGWKEDVASLERMAGTLSILKRRRAECEHHLHRHGFHADRGQCVGDARRVGSGEMKVRSKGRRKKDESRVARAERILANERESWKVLRFKGVSSARS